MRMDRRLFRYIRQMPLFLVIIGGLSIVTGFLIVGQAYMVSHIINQVFLEKQSLTQVFTLLVLLALIIIGRSCIIWINEVVANSVASRAKRELRQKVFDHVLKLGPTYVKGERSGELVNTITDGVEALDVYFSQVLPQICATMVIPLIVLFYAFTVDLLSGIILLVTLPILPFFMILIGKQANTLTDRRWHLLSTMSAHFLDILQGSTTLKLFGRTQRQRENIRKVSDRYGDTTMQVLRVAFLSALVMEMGATLSTALIAVEIGLRLLYGWIPFSLALFVLLLAPEFYQPLRALGPQFHASMESSASAQRIFDILDTPIPASTTTSTTSTVPITLQKDIELRDVRFSYRDTEGNEYPALNGVSFKAQMGQKVAIIGASGAGKTTLANLLLRFIEPTKGNILADGISIQQASTTQWRSLVAWQPQRPYLFNTTIAQNIRMGNETASLDEVQEAAKLAGIHDFIETLPRGYETVIGERGTRLSGGEAQRLSLARALLKNAPLLILDEATSTLDPEVEAHILQSLDQISPNHIMLIIAHRLNTIQKADIILVMNEGRIVARGTDQELQQSSPLYRQLLQAFVTEEARI